MNATSYGLNTLTYQAAKLWNILPSYIKEASAIFEFKSFFLLDDLERNAIVTVMIMQHLQCLNGVILTVCFYFTNTFPPLVML